MEKSYVKPFYLKRSKGSFKKKVTLLIVLIVMSVISPVLIIFDLLYMTYLYKAYKDYKSEKNILLDKARDSYEKEEYKECREISQKVLQIEHENLSGKVLRVLSSFYLEDYEFFLDETEKLRKDNKRVNYDLDIALKRIQSYRELGNDEKANKEYDEIRSKYNIKKEMVF